MPKPRTAPKPVVLDADAVLSKFDLSKPLDIATRADVARQLLGQIKVKEGDAHWQSALISVYMPLQRLLEPNGVRKLTKEEYEVFHSALYNAATMAPSLTDYLSLLHPMISCSLPTLGTDRHFRVAIGHWFFDPSLTSLERGTLLVHEVMHNVLGHYDLKDDDHELSNIAGDAVINQGIEAAGRKMKLPEDPDGTDISVYPRSIKTEDHPQGMPNNLSYEEYYAALLEESKKMKKAMQNARSKDEDRQDGDQPSPTSGSPQNGDGDAWFSGGSRDGGTRSDGGTGAGSPGSSSEQDSSSKNTGQPQDGSSSGPGDDGPQSQDTSGNDGNGQSQDGANDGDDPNGDSKSQPQDTDTDGDDAKSQASSGTGSGESSSKRGDSSGDAGHGIPKNVVCRPMSPEDEESMEQAGVEKATQLDKEMARNGAIAKAMEIMSKNRDESGSRFDQFVLDALRPPKVPWKQILQGVVSRQFNTIVTGGTDYSFRRPSRRSAPGGFIRPSFIAYAPKILVGCDTSGSMGADDYRSVVSEVEGLFKSMAGSEISFVTIDTQITSKQVVRHAKDLKLVGGGGTTMSPLLDYVNGLPAASRPDMVILCTDCYIDWEEYLERMTPDRSYIVLATDAHGYEMAKGHEDEHPNLKIIAAY